jgi:hypothetical protein
MKARIVEFIKLRLNNRGIFFNERITYVGFMNNSNVSYKRELTPAFSFDSLNQNCRGGKRFLQKFCESVLAIRNDLEFFVLLGF